MEEGEDTLQKSNLTNGIKEEGPSKLSPTRRKLARERLAGRHKKVTSIYKQRYAKKWEKFWEFQPWLTKNEKTGKARCLYCNVDINVEKGKTHLGRHYMRIKHKKNERLWYRNLAKSDTNKEKLPVKEKANTKFLTQQVQHAEAQVLAFMVENNLPLSLTDPLVKVLKELPTIGEPVQKIQLEEEKVKSMINQGFIPFFKEAVVEKLKNVLFSIVLEKISDKDETTYLAVCVSYCDKNLQMQVDVLDTIECTTDSVENIFDKLKATITEMEGSGVPLKNWVGFLIDTTNTLFVITHHLAMLINEFYPWVIPIRSPCHMAHLAASTACEQLPDNLEKFCQLLHSHFSKTAIETQPLIKLQEFCHLKAEKVFVPGQERWISVHKFTRQVVELWDSLEEYFGQLLEEEANDDYSAVLQMLKDPLVKVYFQFVEHALSIISIYNKTFQTEEPLFFQLQKETTELICKFAHCFMRMEVVKSAPDMMNLSVCNEVDHLPLDKVYIGLDAYVTLKSHMAESQLAYDDPQVCAMLVAIQNFYKEIISQIQTRFDFSHPVFKLASIINPANAIVVKPPSLSEFFASYEHPQWDKNKMEAEWRAVSNLQLPRDDDILQSPLVFWKFVLSRRSPNGSHKFENLRQIILFFLSLPFSSVIGVKVSRFLRRIDIGTRINIQNINLVNYLRLQSPVKGDVEAVKSSAPKRRRKSGK